MKIKITDQFLILCKENYQDKVTPANALTSSNSNSQELVAIAKEFFHQNRYEEFSRFFLESQYCIDLWTAHLLLEVGSPLRSLYI